MMEIREPGLTGGATRPARLNRHAWTTRELAALRLSYGKVPSKVIAKQLHHSQASVTAAARGMGLRIRAKWTPEADERLLGLVASGLNLRQAAEEMGVTYSAASNRMHMIRVNERKEVR